MNPIRQVKYINTTYFISKDQKMVPRKIIEHKAKFSVCAVILIVIIS